MEIFLNTVSMIVIIAFVIMLPYALIIIINTKLADNYKAKTSLNNKIIKTILLIPPIGILILIISDLFFDIKQYLS